MSEGLTLEQESKLNEAFFLIDQDNDKYISVNEVGILLRALGIFISENDIEKLKNDLDSKVSYETFKNIYINRLKNNLSSNDLYEAFKYFDNDQDGKVNINMLKHGLMTLGEPLSPEEMKILEEELNLDENEEIDYEDLSQKIYGAK